MNNADLLTAALRQTAAGKAGAKGGLKGRAPAQEGKEKADHFHEQLRLMAKEPKVVAPKAVNGGAETRPAVAAPVLDVASVLAELTADAGQKPEVKDDEDAGGDEAATGSPTHWRGPDGALSAAISKLDSVQPASSGRHETTSRVSASTPDVGVQATPQEPASRADAAPADSRGADAPSAQRFAVSVEAADIKPLAAVKAVVRDQETHFEPVQQVTVLQKIVDRMASDLPAAASPETAQAADIPVADTGKADSRPLRMMTLELDPPNLGSVTVRMRLAGDVMQVHVTADRYETTQLLRQERGALTDAMQSAGYTFDIASIDHSGTPDSNPNGGQLQQQASDQRSSLPSPADAQTSGGAPGRSTGDSQGGTRQNRQNHEQLHRPTERQQTEDIGRARSSTVYL